MYVEYKVKYPAQDIKVFIPHLEWLANYNLCNIIVCLIYYEHIEFDDLTKHRDITDNLTPPPPRKN